MEQRLFFPVSNAGVRSLPFSFGYLTMNHLQEPVERPAGIPYFQWIQCLNGTGELILSGHKTPLTPGSGIFLHPDIPHQYYATSGDFYTNYYGFQGEGIFSLLKDSVLMNSGVFCLKEPELLIRQEMAFFQISLADPLHAAYEYSENVYRILLSLLEYTAPSNAPALADRHFFEDTLVYIASHLSQPVSIEELAALTGLTKEYFCMKFKKVIGMTPITYINKQRMGQAIQLLGQNSALSICEISHACGFEDTSYFISIFKKELGMTPGAFRKEALTYHTDPAEYKKVLFNSSD